MTVLAASTGTGYAVGAAAGRLVDMGGHRPAFMVTVVATLLAATLAAGGARMLRRAMVSRPVEVEPVEDRAEVVASR